MRQNKGVSVLILGGAGSMGQSAVAMVKKLLDVERVTIADYNGEKALRIAALMGEKVDAPGSVDALNFDALVLLMRDYDYAISTLGPDHKFGTHVIKAAIAAKVHYLDICGDWKWTLEMLALDRTAQRAGIHALIGAGASPGVTNMLALKAINELDNTQTLYTGWGATSRTDSNDDLAGPDTGGALAATEHWVHQTSGRICVRHGRKFIYDIPLKRHILRRPIGGRCNVYTIGHPEAVTLPKYFPEISNCYNVMDMPDFVISLLKSLRSRVDAKAESVEEAAIYLDALMGGNSSKMRLFDICRYGFQTAREVFRDKKYMPDMHATALGMKNGGKQTVCVSINGRVAGGMGPMTCAPIAVFLSMFIDGTIKQTGVYAPEAVIDPDVFFERFTPYVTKDIETHPPVIITRWLS